MKTFTDFQREVVDRGRIWWYQAGGDIKDGDFVIETEPDTIVKWDGKNGVPLGRATHATYCSKYEYGDRVPTLSIWINGHLREVLKIGDMTFVVGEEYDYIKRVVAGKSYSEILQVYEAKKAFDEIIYKLKKMRDSL